jgi:NADP-dependent 3-hydroxy acid dehydrogenase YdfG/acyl carrier protein
VLVTGASGAIGKLLARHLAAAHGVRHLILASRRGAEAPGAAELRAELGELGAEAELVACDVSDRRALEQLLATIPPERPLAAVFHGAALADDATIASLDPARVAAVMAPKAAAAWHLHELTRGIEGCELVLFSSIAGSFQSPGQGNYAAANAFLDALARRRSVEGLAGMSLAWGLWETGAASGAALARIARAGVVEMSPDGGLALFDRSRSHLGEASFLILAELDRAALRSAAREGRLAPVLRGLVRVPVRRAAAAGLLAERLAAAPADEREGVVLEVVRTQVAGVLGHESGAAVDPVASFKDLGFDSLLAVELRNRLVQVSGLRLPPTLVFDYPTATGLARFLLEQLEGGAAGPGETDRKLDSIGSILASMSPAEHGRARARLRAMLAGLGENGRESKADADLENSSDEELLELIDAELGGRR